MTSPMRPSLMRHLRIQLPVMLEASDQATLPSFLDCCGAEVACRTTARKLPSRLECRSRLRGDGRIQPLYQSRTRSMPAPSLILPKRLPRPQIAAGAIHVSPQVIDAAACEC